MNMQFKDRNLYKGIYSINLEIDVNIVKSKLLIIKR